MDKKEILEFLIKSNTDDKITMTEFLDTCVKNMLLIKSFLVAEELSKTKKKLKTKRAKLESKVAGNTEVDTEASI